MTTENESPSSETASGRPRVVLLGASNVARSFSTLLSASRAVFQQPIDFVTACGHGRSFGIATRALGREIPGIVPCGLWNHLQQQPAAATYALLTDIGNDLVYDVPPETILGWVRECLERLIDAGTPPKNIVVTMLPMGSISQVGWWRYQFFRMLLFRGCQLKIEEIICRAEQINSELTEIFSKFSVTVIEQPKTWYGFDPIHHRRALKTAVWSEILSSWNRTQSFPNFTNGRYGEWFYIRSRVPHERRVFGRTQRRQTPIYPLRDDSTLAIF